MKKQDRKVGQNICETMCDKELVSGRPSELL